MIRTDISQYTIRNIFPKEFQIKECVIPICILFEKYMIVLVERPFVCVIRIWLVGIYPIIPAFVEEKLTIVDNGSRVRDECSIS
jgi:hypothetical protein